MGEGPVVEHPRIAARIYTPSGWIGATFHVPEGETLVSYLNDKGPAGARRFVTLTDVTLPGQGDPLPFFALQRSAILFVVAGEEAHLPTGQADGTQERRVVCLFEGGVVMGALDTPVGQRVSDVFAHADGFFLLRECTIGAGDAARPSMEAHGAVVASASRLLGVAEAES